MDMGPSSYNGSLFIFQFFGVSPCLMPTIMSLLPRILKLKISRIFDLVEDVCFTFPVHEREITFYYWTTCDVTKASISWVAWPQKMIKQKFIFVACHLFSVEWIFFLLMSNHEEVFIPAPSEKTFSSKSHLEHIQEYTISLKLTQ